MRRSIAAFVGFLVVLGITLAGCANTVDAHVGRYVGYALSIPGLGDPEPIESTYDEGENYVELHEDGTATVCLDGDPIDASYSVDGEDITITMGDSENPTQSEGSVKDGVLTIDIVGIGFELTFVKEGTAKPFEVVEGGIVSGVAAGSDRAETVPVDITVADDELVSIVAKAKQDYLGDPAFVLAIANKSDLAISVMTSSDEIFMVGDKETTPYLTKRLEPGESASDVYLWWSSSEVSDVAGLESVTGRLEISNADTGEQLATYDFAA